jgi:hypothetical protein
MSGLQKISRDVIAIQVINGGDDAEKLRVPVRHLVRQATAIRSDARRCGALSRRGVQL